MKNLFIRVFTFCSIMAAVALSASASEISGSVTNKTTSKPSSGDEVVLLKLSQGMQEAARSKTDSQGKFTLQVPDDAAQHLVRVTHDGVNYFRPAPAGTTTVTLDVYDAARAVEGVKGRADILRVQTDGNQMEVTELFVLQNDSKPPRTRMSDRSFEITLPEGTVLDSSLAAGPGGMPVNSSPVPLGDKGHYAYVFPIRPGETKFQIAYHLPYSGTFEFHPQIHTTMEDVVVMLPKSMNFKGDGSLFANGGEEKGMSIFVAHNVAAGTQLAFSVSGTGQIPRDAQDGEASGAQAAESGTPDNRPGGGLGKPEETPDPLHAYRWWIIGGLAAALVVGAVVVVNQRPRSGAPLRPSTPSGAYLPDRETTASASAAPNRTLFLEAMKEELFQLETDRLQGRISDGDYQQAKAAFDLTMKRALERTKQART